MLFAVIEQAWVQMHEHAAGETMQSLARLQSVLSDMQDSQQRLQGRHC